VSSPADRLRLAWQQILSGLLPALATYVRWEFRVLSVSPGPPVLISASAVNGACPFPSPISNITLWPGPCGCYAIPPVGSLVLLEFHEGSETKPSIAGLDPSNPPILITLGAGTDPIAMSALVSSQLANIATALETHVHTGVQTGVGTSGTAAPVYTPGSVASTLPVVSE